MPYVTVPKIVEIVEHPFALGAGTANGVQVSTPVNTATANEFVVVEQRAINAFGGIEGGPGGESAQVLDFEYGLTMQVRATGGQNTTPAYVLWQARNWDTANAVVSPWADLFPEHTQAANLAADWTDITYSGRAALTNTLFTKLPCEVRALVKCNVANVNATHTAMMGRTKNSSYVRVLYRIA